MFSSPAVFWKTQSGVEEILDDQQGPTKLRPSSFQASLTLNLFKTYLKLTMLTLFKHCFLTCRYRYLFQLIDKQNVLESELKAVTVIFVMLMK